MAMVPPLCLLLILVFYSFSCFTPRPPAPAPNNTKSLKTKDWTSHINNDTKGAARSVKKKPKEKKKPAKAAFEASADEYVRNQPFFSFFVGCLVALSSSFAQ